MIIDGPFNYSLTAGQLRVIPTSEDTKTVVPASIQPVVGAMQTTMSGLTSATPRETSFLTETERIQPASTAGIAVGVVTLVKGLWELEMNLSFQSDFAGTPAVPLRVRSQLSYQGNVFDLISFYLTIGAREQFARFRLLLVDTGNVALNVPSTGAAQTMVGRLLVNATRVL